MWLKQGGHVGKGWEARPARHGCGLIWVTNFGFYYNENGYKKPHRFRMLPNGMMAFSGWWLMVNLGFCQILQRTTDV